MIVYLVTNTVNGKGYVGITKLTLEERWHIHVKAARRGVDYALLRAIRKYGADAFTREVLIEADTWTDLCRLEREAIALWNTHIFDGHGYNMTYGGDGRLGWNLSEEAKATIGRKNRGRKRTPEQIVHITETRASGDAHHTRRNPPTQEQLAALQEGHQRWRAAGGKLSEEGRRKQAATITGHAVSAETRQKIAETLRGNVPWNKGVETGPTGKPAWNTGKASSKVVLSEDVVSRGRKRAIMFDGVEYASIKEACIKTGFSRAGMHKKLLRGDAQYIDKD